MSTRIAVNGLGRIGRATVRAAFERDADVEFVAFNDITDTETLAYLLAHDSVYGAFAGSIEPARNAIRIDGTEIPVLCEPDPAALPWRELGADVVIEATGRF